MRRILIYVMLGFMLCLSGCMNVKDIKVNDVEIESLSTRGLKSLDIFVKVGVDNPVRQVKISEIDGSLKHSGKVIGKLAMDPFVLAARTSDVYLLKANVSLAKGAGLKELMVLAAPNGLDECTIDLSAKATYGKSVSMPIKVKDIPLKELLDKIENEKN